MFQPNFMTHAFSFDTVFTYNSINKTSTKPKNQTRYDSAFSYVKLPLELDELQASECKSENSYFTKVLRGFIISVSYILVLILFPLTMWFCVKKIHALERLVIFRLGKLQPVVGPGFCMVLPFVDLWKWVDLSSKTAILPTQQLLTVDGGIIEVVAEIKYCVGHVVHYVTRSHCQEQSIEDLGICCLTNIISGKEQSDVEQNKELITSNVKMELNKTVVSWGIQVLDVVIPSVKLLKKAEPVNPLNSILNALKAVNPAAGNGIQSAPSADHSLVDMEGVIDVNRLHIPAIDTKSCTLVDSDSILVKLKKYAEKIAKHSSVTDVSASYKFKIIDQHNDDKIIFLSFHEGTPMISEGENTSRNADVVIILSLSVMEALLTFKLSPVQAYVGGDIEIIGDFNLLKHFNTND